MKTFTFLQKRNLQNDKHAKRIMKNKRLNFVCIVASQLSFDLLCSARRIVVKTFNIDIRLMASVWVAVHCPADLHGNQCHMAYLKYPA